VWEWCQDWYGVYPSGEQINPTGLEHGSDRVLRGGSWSYDATFLRGADRRWNWPSNRDSSVGFRVVWPVSPGAASGLECIPFY